MLVDGLRCVCWKIVHDMFMLVIHSRSTNTIVRKYTAGRPGSQDSCDFRENKHTVYVLRLKKAIGDAILSKHGFLSEQYRKVVSVDSQTQFSRPISVWIKRVVPKRRVCAKYLC